MTLLPCLSLGCGSARSQAPVTGAAENIPVMKWSCLEWEFNDDPDEINVWGDGNVIGSLNNMTIAVPKNTAPGTPLFHHMNSGLIGAFTDFGFGFYDWHPQTRRRSTSITTTLC